jgi:hypothetical protein
MSDPLADMFSGFGAADRATVAALTSRAAIAEQRLARIVALCRDPEQSHRMLTRRELLRIAEGRE